MSSHYVRQLVEGWLQDPAMQTPFYPTVNIEQNPRDAVWFTAAFGSSYRDVLTYCDGVELEEGEIELVFFGPPGQGYSAVIQALEADLSTLLTQRDPNGKLVLTGRSAPYEYSDGTANDFYAMSVYIDYQYYP